MQIALLQYLQDNITEEREEGERLEDRGEEEGVEEEGEDNDEREEDVSCFRFVDVVKLETTLGRKNVVGTSKRPSFSNI